MRTRLLPLEKSVSGRLAQVEMSHDGGETASEIASCLEGVFDSLPGSSLSPVEQLLSVIDAEPEDEYELCQGPGSRT